MKFDNPYSQVTLISLAEIVCYPVTGTMSKVFGAKGTMIFCLCTATLGGVLVTVHLIWINDTSFWFYACLMMCMFGAAGAWNAYLCALAHIFPVSLIASAYGAIIFITQMVNISSPYIV